MSVSTIKSYILTKLGQMGNLKASFGYPTANPNGKYPFAVLTVGEGEGSFADPRRNLRRQSYIIRVYQEQSKQGQGVQTAEDITVSVLDEIQRAFDMDTTLSGNCKWSGPVRWNTTYENRELDVRLLEVTVDVNELVDSI